MKELYESSKYAKVDEVKGILRNSDFSSQAIDHAIRHAINGMSNERVKYYEAIEELLKKCDINFRCVDDNKCTLLMTACALNEYYLIEILMNRDYSKNIESKADILKMNEKDANNRNCIHYLLTLDPNHMTMYRQRSEYNSELNILNILYYLTDHIEESGKKSGKQTRKCNPNFNLKYTELYEKDKEGHTPLSLSLMRGYYKVAKYIVSKGVLKGLGGPINNKDNTQPAPSGLAKFTVTSNGNNLLHCAIYGKNINNLYLILSYCSISDLLQKNKDNLTPAEYAKSLNLNFFHKVLKFYESNLTNFYASKYASSSESFVDVGKLLSDVYCNEKYDETLYALEKLRLSNSLGEVSPNGNSLVVPKDSVEINSNCSIYNDLSINWNILLCQYMQLKKKITVTTVNSKQELIVKPEQIVSKFCGSSTQKDDSLFQRMNNFFSSNLSFINQEIIQENSQLLVLLFNKIVFFYKTSNHSGCIKSCYELLSFMRNCKQPIDESFSFILFLNTSLILVEVLLNHNMVFLASILLERIEMNLAMKYNDKINESLDEQIKKYLTSIEYLHNGTKTWDEIYCVVNLMKALRDLCHSYNELKNNDSVKFIKTYEELEKKCKYKNQLPIFNGIRIFYDCIRAKMCYLDNSLNYNQLNKILAEIYSKVQNHNLQKGKESIPDNPSTSFAMKEAYIFYCNSQGVSLLKQKKYNMAELHLKAGLTFINKLTFIDSPKKEFSFSVKLGYLHILKYNLALVYFFQKKYSLSRNILSNLSISNNTQITSNIFLWYRLGLSNLELVNYGFIETDNYLNQSNNEENVNKQDNKCFNHPYHISNANCLFSSCKPIYKLNKSSNENNYENDVDDAYSNSKSTCSTLINSNQIILISKSKPKPEEVEFLNDAIFSFKQILNIVNQDLKGNHILCGKALYEIFSIYSAKPYYIDDQELIPLVNSNFKSKSNSIVVMNTYLNLIFALICLEKWNEVLFYIEDYETSEYFGIGSSNYSNEINFKFLSYKLITNIHLKNYQAAKDISEKIVEGTKGLNNNPLSSLKLIFKYQNFFTTPEVAFSLAMLVNITKMHYSQGNILEGDKTLALIIQNIMKEKVLESEFPFYVLNLVIFTLLHKGYVELVTKIVKYRKIYEVLTEVKLIKNKN